ncbi:sensor histidine kinase [Paenibacillus vulneris]|uniref:histidine kinase n=1 Tax=Paenibacillus vulneris TaxID=1133364 RepID=A0ABW3UME3_9BACL
MATKLKNKALAAAAVCITVLWAISALCFIDSFKHASYLDTDYYAKGGPLYSRIYHFYTMLKVQYIDPDSSYKNYSQKLDIEKIGKAEYDALKEKAYREADQGKEAREASIRQSYALKMEQAEKSGNADLTAQLTEERNQKLAESQQLGDRLLAEMVKKRIAVLDQEYADRQKQLDAYNDAIFYFIRDNETNETYTNMNPAPSSAEDLTKTALYREAAQSIALPLSPEMYTSLPYKDFTSSLQFMSNSFEDRHLSGLLILPENALYSKSINKDYTYYLSVRERIIKELILGGVCLIGALGFMLYWRRSGAARILFQESRTAALWRRIPLDVRALLMLPAAWIGWGCAVDTAFFFRLPLRFEHVYQLSALSLCIFYLLFHLEEALWLFRRRDTLRELRQRCLYRRAKGSIGSRLTTKGVMFKAGLLFVLTVLIGPVLLMLKQSMLYGSGGGAMVGLLYLALFAAWVGPYALRRIRMLNQMTAFSSEMAAGRFPEPIEAKGRGNLPQLAQHLNRMREGFQASLENQVRNERLKTELITNVSHDLKTPLTSILNYIDLLKQKELTADETARCVDVLDRKSQRLKILIDDLFEASKMSSGAVELTIEEVNVSALLTQALAEYSDKIDSSDVTFRVQIAHPHILARLDGNKTWRVFDNLLSNALKYSLPHSRVYVSLEEQAGQIVLTMKNVSAYEIDFEVEELFERFKRGDRSRHTEGSGLGLAIAKSIVELQQGQLKIEIDSDYFKAIVTFPQEAPSPKEGPSDLLMSYSM